MRFRSMVPLVLAAAAGAGCGRAQPGLKRGPGKPAAHEPGGFKLPAKFSEGVPKMAPERVAVFDRSAVSLLQGRGYRVLWNAADVAEVWKTAGGRGPAPALDAGKQYLLLLLVPSGQADDVQMFGDGQQLRIVAGSAGTDTVVAAYRLNGHPVRFGVLMPRAVVTSTGQPDR